MENVSLEHVREFYVMMRGMSVNMGYVSGNMIIFVTLANPKFNGIIVQIIGPFSHALLKIMLMEGYVQWLSMAKSSNFQAYVKHAKDNM